MTDLSLLKKCEEFLLHPTVRALSLAQRVDFLEKKGLSPEKITQCLKSVERHNGLSQLVQRTSEHLTTLRASPYSLTLLQHLRVIVKKHGIATMLLALLSYAYVQLKMRKAQQRLLQHEGDKTQHRKRRRSRVEALLSVIKDQQLQYNQAAMLLGARVTTAQKEAAQSTKVDTCTSMTTQKLELQALQSELIKVKSAVVDTLLQPQITRIELDEPKEVKRSKKAVKFKEMEEVREVEGFKEFSTPLRPASEGSEVGNTESVPFWSMKEEEQTAKQSKSRDQTTMSPEQLIELFERGQAQEELSTACSYRFLFAS